MKRRCLSVLGVWLGLAVAAPDPAGAQPSPPTAREPRPGLLFRVQGVDLADVLNMRARPDPRSPVVGIIPPTGRGVRLAGGQRAVGSARWWQVTYKGTDGWVNARFLVVDSTPAAAPDAAPPEVASTLAEDIICFLNEPIWRLELRRDGRASCTDMCQGGSGLHTAVAPAAAGSGWTITVRESGGGEFMAVTVRRISSCKDDVSGQVGRYEVTARRPRGPAFKGCCLPLSS